MYRVTYEQLLEILEKGDCPVALTELSLKNIDPEKIKTIEVDFTIEDKDTEHEMLTVNEFNIYTKFNTVLFGTQLKYDSDFIVECSRTKPSPIFTVLGQEQMDLPDVPPGTKENLEFLLERALDASEYADTSKEKHTGYAECDKAYADVANTLSKMSVKMNFAQGRVGDLSRVIEKQSGDPETDAEINKRLDEIYNILDKEM